MTDFIEDKKRCVFIIPYFGKMPDYYDIWKKSAAQNYDFSFYIYSDLPFDNDNAKNIVIKHITFEELKEKIQEKFEFKISLNTPYKLCDFKPAYGMIFEDDIREFDFWGFCDMDLVFGDIKKFITQDILKNNDKVLNHGHFCLLRNNETMKRLFLEKYEHVQDYRHAFTTDYCCHFDESGTIAFASEFTKSINSYVSWTFFDVPTNYYPLMFQNEEVVAIWNRGCLKVYKKGDETGTEILYIHLQKRKMIKSVDDINDTFAIRRNEFLDLQSEIQELFSPYEYRKEKDFIKQRKTARKKEIIRNLREGAIKNRFNRWRNKWRTD